MTAQSETSVTLLRILLEDRFSLKPDYVCGGSVSLSDDACLLIGDQALEENERHRFAFGYDLGTLWQAWQGVPFVFGAWVISKSALVPESRPVVERYMELTQESIAKFREDKAGALDRWLARYPVNLPRPVVDEYYNALDYRFTDQRKESLKLFFEYAFRRGVVPEVPKLEFL
jgi:chorismate dehydratase